MALRLYNSLSQKIEKFVPLNGKEVKMYVCGITPYDTTHLGHAFTYIFFDTLIRYLKFQNFDVTYTQNVTDINDRDNDLLKRAKEQGVAWQNLANFWTDKFLEDMHALNWTMPDHYLWASAHISGMIKQIDELLVNGIAYQKNGGVYLDISKSPNFGKLSRLSEREMMNVAHEFDEDLDNPDKKNPLDVTLWRPTITDQPPHIPSFDSPYGEGRPGWHLECSSMGFCSLGEQIDIHGGGVDLIYPHHEVEIAQAEGASNKIPFAKYWIHTQLVSYQGNKMSKSLGNLVLISDLLEKHSANSIRYVLLSHHYREPWEFNEDELIEAAKKITRITQIIKSESKNNNSTIQQFNNILDEDMDTPRALEVLLKTENKEEIKQMTDILGFKF